MMADFDISALISADSSTFVRAMESTSGSIRNVLKSIDPTVAAIDRFNQQTRVLENGLKSGAIAQDAYAAATARLKAQTEATVASLNRTQQASGASRAGMQQLSYQMNDVATQFASGTGAMQIFAQQSTQIIQAIALMRGSAGGFIGFLAGPWGGALTNAAIIAVPLIDRIFGIGDAADKSKVKVDALASALDRVRNERGSAADEGQVEVSLNRLRNERLSPALQRGRGEDYNSYQRRMKGRPAQIDAEIASLEQQLKWNEAVRVSKEATDGLGKAQDSSARSTAAATRATGANATGANAAALRDAAQAQRDAVAAVDAGIAASQAFASKIADEKQSLIDLYDKPLKDAQDYSAVLEKIERLQKLGEIKDNTALRYKAAATTGPMSDQIEDLSRALDAWGKKNAVVTEKASTDWKTASDNILSSLQHLKSGIQSGDFLDILSGALDIFTSLAGVGAFGSKAQSAIAGALASGGPVSAGSTYLVGERGPELFTPSTSGHIVANHNLSKMQASGAIGGGVSVQIVPSDYFDVIVDQRAAAVAAPMAIRSAQAGSGLAQQSIQRRNRNRLR